MPSCRSCGAEVPKGQRDLCSMCYGDPAWGRDGYYEQAMLEDARRQEQKQELPPEQEERDA